VKILRTYESWIHTHFVTDGQQLPSPRVREIERGVTPLLRRLGIVFGVHLERERSDPGIRVVLECRPSAAELTQIRSRLDDLLAPIPRRPPVTVVRAVEAPAERSPRPDIE
jgi:hypothetical protein